MIVFCFENRRYAIYISCSIPLFASPIIINKEIYLDGGLINNNPIDLCLKKHKSKHILSIKYYIEDIINRTYSIDENIFLYIQTIFEKYINNIKQISTKYQILFPIESLCNQPWKSILNNSKLRKELIRKGELYGDLFLNYNTSCTN